jgi:hypothetical protein
MMWNRKIVALGIKGSAVHFLKKYSELVAGCKPSAGGGAHFDSFPFVGHH